VVERLGKYDRTLKAGFNFIVPVLERVAHRVDVLERQISSQPERISIITKDNVEITLLASVFFRVTDAAKSVYRIQDLIAAIRNAVTSTVRSTCGQMEFDEIQGRREHINERFRTSLLAACEVWGVEITRTEVLDVEVDANTKSAMQKQLNAERAKHRQCRDQLEASSKSREQLEASSKSRDRLEASSRRLSTVAATAPSAEAPSAETTKTEWIMVCHMMPVSVKAALGEPRLPASMNVRSRWIEEMPTIAMASLIFSTLAFTWLSHSG
jgi:regulator of protease activity HflC (stomatin/prohibitin superfamily)